MNQLDQLEKLTSPDSLNSPWVKHDFPFSFVDLSDMPDQPYRQLIVFKSYMSNFMDMASYIADDFTGRILIDTMFTIGNNSDRFVEGQIENGKIDYDSFAVVTIARKDPLRILSNKAIVDDPEGINDGVLLSHQKKLLLKGLSI